MTFDSRASNVGKKAVLLFLAATLVVACGGGGGGSRTPASPPSTSPPPPDVPATAPPAPVVNYTGVTSPADLSDETVGAMADSILVAILNLLEIAEEIPHHPVLPGEVFDRTIAGTEGGSAHLTGRGAQDGTYWLHFEASDYAVNGSTYNGGITMGYAQLPNGENGNRTQLWMRYHSMRHTTSGSDASFSGSIARAYDGYGQTVTGTILVQDHRSEKQFFAEDVTITESFDLPRELIASGRAYDPRYGYVEFESEDAWGFKPENSQPHYGGPIRAVGLDARYLLITPLTPSIIAIDYVGPGQTQPTKSARLAWSTFEPQLLQDPLDPPVADAGASRYVPPGTTVTLDGRFSEHPQSSLLSFNWKLLFKPAGSTAALNTPIAVQPQVTLDKEGRYVIELEVSDGVHSARDVMVLTANSDVGLPVQPIAAQLPPDRSYSSAVPFSVSKALVTATSLYDPVPALTLTGLPPFGLSVDVQQTTSQATITPSERGVYALTLSSGSLSNSDVHPIDSQWVAIDTPMPFAPAGALTMEGPSSGGVATGDFNEDGRSDIIASRRRADNSGIVQILMSNSQGYFDAPLVVDVAHAGSVAVGDISGDGRLDIVSADRSGLVVLRHDVDGSFTQSSRGLCSSSVSDRDLSLADLNNDGRLDIVTLGCYRQVHIFLQDATGALQSPTSISIGRDSDMRIATGDVTGDGIADVVALASGAQGDPYVALIRGVSSGIPEEFELLPFESAFSRPIVGGIAVGDVNGDGRADVVLGDIGRLEPQLEIFLQAADGELQAPRILYTRGDTRKLRVADLNRDGLVDIAKAGAGVGLLVHYAVEQGVFDEMTADLRPTADDRFPSTFPEAVGDFNGDGKLDFAFLHSKYLGVALGWE